MAGSVDISSIGSFAPIDITWGARSQPSSQRAGAAQFESLSMVKEIDDTSPQLLQALARGTTLDSLTITFTGATPATAEFDSVSVVAMDLQWTSGDDPHESVAFQFRSFTYTVGKQSASWDLPKNAPR